MLNEEDLMATITTQTIKVDLTPGRVYPVLHVSQGDVGLEALEFYIYQNNQPYTIPAEVTAINIDGMTPVGVFSYPCTWSGNVVTAGLTATMTAEKGVDISELAFYDATNNKIGTCNFVIAVEESPFTNAHVSASDMATIMAAASSAQQYELLSKSWAVGDTGIRTGENTNNSEYWSEISESWAIGDTGKRTGENTNNSEYWSTVSHQYANTISFKTYDTVAQMVADTGLLDGAVCRTLGFYSINDGGEAFYKIRALGTGETADGAAVITLSNGLVAEINLLGAYVNFKALGAKANDNTFDNALVLQKALTYIYTKFPCTNMTGGHQRGGGTIYIPGGMYYFLTGEIDLNGYYNLKIVGDNKGNTILVNRNTYLLHNASQNTMGLYIKDITVVNNGLISSINAWDYTFENCRFFNIQPDTNAFAIRLYLTVNVKFIRCTFYNCKDAVVLSGSAGVGASTSVLFESCWFAHCSEYGLNASFSNNKIVTLWIKNSIFEYNGTAITLQGNTSNESVAALQNLHFEGNTNTVIINYFTAYLYDLLLPDNDVVKINGLSSLNSVTGFLPQSSDLVYQNNLGHIRVRFNDGTLYDSASGAYYEVIYASGSQVTFERYGNEYFLRVQGADATMMQDFFTNCKNYLPSGYIRAVVADTTSGNSVVLSMRSADLNVIKLSPWGYLTTYALHGSVVIPSASAVYKN